jgi:hypothetical protein
MDIPPPLTGYLTKRGHIIKNWKLRFVVLEQGRLQYYEEGDNSPSARPPYGRGIKGSMSLSDVVFGGRSAKDPLKLFLIDQMAEKELYMRSCSSEEAEVWERHLKLHCAFARSFPDLALTAANNAEQDAQRRYQAVESRARAAIGASGGDRKGSVRSVRGRSVSADQPIDSDDDEDETFEVGNDPADVSLVVCETFEAVSEEGDAEGSDKSSGADEQEVSAVMKNLGIGTISTEKLRSVLVSTGKKIKQLEEECRKAQESITKDFTKTQLPALKATIKDLDLRVAALKKRVKNEAARGDDHIKMLEAEIDVFMVKLDENRCKKYFPDSVITFGSGGFYVALDYFWVERLSGKFDIRLLPNSVSLGGHSCPQIFVRLLGHSATTEAGDGDGCSSSVDKGDGVVVKLQMGGFKLKADGIPAMSFDNFPLEVTLRVSLILTYNIETKSWIASSNDFKVTILSFKGPFGGNKSLISSILALAVPIIKHVVLKLIPPEIGMLLASLPSATVVCGDFEVTGAVPIHALQKIMHSSPEICEVLGYTHKQMLLFSHLQKIMQLGGKQLNSILNLIEYKQGLEKHTSLWAMLEVLWDHAAALYSQYMVEEAGDERLVKDVFSFSKLMVGVENILKNPISISVRLSQLEASIGLRSLLSCGKEYFEGLVKTWTKNNSRPLAKEQDVMATKIFELLKFVSDGVDALSASLDYANFRVAATVHAGPDGEVRALISDIAARGPLVFAASLPKDMDIALDNMVPMMLNLRSGKQGTIDTKLYHLGGPGMQNLIKFAAFKKSEASPGAQKAGAGQGRTGGQSGSRAVSMEDVSSAQNRQAQLLREYVAEVDRPKLEVAALLDCLPDPHTGADTMLHLRLLRPNISFIIDEKEAKPLTLQPGAPLFTIQLGPVSAADAAHAPVPSEGIMDDDFLTDGYSDDPDDKCALLLETASKVRIQAHVPEIRVRVMLPVLFRYVYEYFKDKERLVCFIGQYVAVEANTISKYIDFVKLIMDFMSLQLLHPNRIDLDLSDLAVSVSTCKQEGIKVLVNPLGGASAADSASDGDNVLELHATINLMEIIRDASNLAAAFMELQEPPPEAIALGTSVVFS